MRGATALAAAALVVPLAVASPSDAESPKPAGAGVATIGDRTITRTEVEERVRPKLIEIENERYEALREGLDELIAEEVEKREAKARGITVEQLEEQEVKAKAGAPTDAEIQKLYDENKSDLGGQSLEQIKPRIVEYLKQQKMDQRREAFIAELKTKYKAAVSLKPPVVEVATAGRPEKGAGAKAPVTIIEFSDYQCPFCQRAENVVDEVMKAYGSKVRLVFRDYPLPMHPQARPAAEAANCAHAQGKFWEYHAKLFANQAALGDDKLKEYAKELGLDAPKFEKCLADKPFKDAIDKDIADGGKVGVNGTPAFFINGRVLSGAQPFEKFKEVIDEELSAKGASPS
jgi:protein-disulfide isomerase